MPHRKFEVDIEETNYGYVIIEANDEEEAKRLVNAGYGTPNEIFTGTSIRAIDAIPAYE